MSIFNDIPSVLYHYCSINEFTDIISNRRFIMNDIQKSDRFSNLQQVMEILYDRVKIKEKEIIHSLSKDSDNIFRTIPIAALKEQIEKYKHNIIPFFYVFSLTSNYNKWYMYEKYSSDICIGFKSSFFTNFKANDIINLKKVNYNVANLKKDIDDIIEKYIKEYIDKEKDTDDNTGNSFEKIWEYINNDFVNNSIAYKNEYFSDEQEYRFTINSSIRSIFLENNKSYENLHNVLNCSFNNETASLSNLNFIVENNQIVSHRYFGYKYIPNLIDCIYINPLSSVDVSDIELLLSINNITLPNCQIIKSIIE